MKTIIFEFTRDGIETLDRSQFDIKKLNPSSVYWYQLYTSSREEAARELQKLQFDAVLQEWITQPEEHTRFRIRGEVVSGELSFHSPDAEGEVDYLGIIIKENLFLTIAPEQDEPSQEVIEEFVELYGPEQRTDMSLLFYTVVNEFISAHAQAALTYRKQVEEIARRLDKGIHHVKPVEIMDLKDKIAALANVLEEQYFTLSFAPRRDWSDESQPYRAAFRELLKTLEILKTSLVQISQRLESIHSHYMLLIQETSNRRINILTIVQAVFVPLTLFAGIYGMNFSNIPELEWKYSYFVFLAAMVVLVVVELRYFYKKGWFD